MRSWTRRVTLPWTLSAALALAVAPAFGQAPGPQPGRVYKVGFSQIVDHPALNETDRKSVV